MSPEMWPVTSLWRLMLCKLQFALDRDHTASSRFRRGNTFTALGSAAHRLEELVHKGRFDDVDESAVPNSIVECWEKLIQSELNHLHAEWPEYEPVKPRDLPKYAYVFCNATDRAANLALRRRARGAGGPRIVIEETLVDDDLRIEGRPDRYVVSGDSFSVTDIKSGAATSEIQPAHRHQLLTYCHLIAKTKGLVPKSILIQDVEGNCNEEPVTSDVVANHISKVVEIRDEYTRISAEKEGFTRNAQPNTDACRYCNYRVICAAYWTLQDDERQRDDFVGTVEVVPKYAAFTVRREKVRVGEPEYVTVLGYKPAVSIGSRVAIAGGYLHHNVMRAGIGTTVFIIEQPNARSS